MASLMVLICVPVTNALLDSYRIADLINRKRFPPDFEEKQEANKKAKKDDLGPPLVRISGF